jgi:putative hydrolase of the HAD superfamily
MKYRAVIFDLFGTLVENFTVTEYERVLAEMAAILGAPPAEFRQAWLDTFRGRTTGELPTSQSNIEHICRLLKIKVTAEQVERAARARLEYTARSMKPCPGALEVLARLRTEGYQTGLVSDCSSEVPAVWGGTPFATLFDVTVFSCVAGIKKPDPRIYRMALSRLGVTARDCLYVGDGSSNELTGALKVGMHPVQLRDPGESADAHFIEREDWRGETITSLIEVLELVK